MKYHNVKLDAEAGFRLRVMDAYNRMGDKDVKGLCLTFGVSRSWFYKWRARYNPQNLTSLKSFSRKPKKLSCIDWSAVTEICEWKRLNSRKSQYYLYNQWVKSGRVPPCSPKTIYNWWKRRNLIITRYRRKRARTRLFNQAKLPGELVQIDTKFLPRRKYQYTAIDVVSKWRLILVYDKLTQENSIDFVKRFLIKAKERNIQINLIQTDNGHEFQRDFASFLAGIGIKHQYTWIHTPDQNGVVERSHRTDEEEFYQETEIDYTNLEDINTKLKIWLEYYNTKRLHFSLNYLTPEEYLGRFKVSTI